MPHTKNKKILQLISPRTLCKAIENNNIVGAKFLLAHGIDPNQMYIKNFATLKIVQNPDECSKYFLETLLPSTIEMIEKLEQEYEISLSGVNDGN